MQGTIKSFLEEKGYGFIIGDDGNDYFFHANAFKSDKDRAEICDGLSVVFDGVPTPKGYRAKSISYEVEPKNLKYEVPMDVQISKTGEVRGWQLIEDSSWRFFISSRNSIDDTRDELCSKAKQFGANALINYHYGKRTGSEAGTGKGTHHFTIHEISAQPVNVAKRSNTGTQQEADFDGLNGRIEDYLVKRKKWQKRLGLAALLAALIILVAPSGTIVWPVVIACVIAAATYLFTGCGWIRSL